MMERRAIVVPIGILLALMPLAPVVWEGLRFQELPEGTTIDRVIVEKSKRELHVLSNGDILKSYRIALGGAPTGAKQFEGDGRTPEGTYWIDGRNDRSQFYLALRISYPNVRDKARARAAGRDPGGAIMIHGLPNALGLVGPLHRVRDWTQGCIAVTDREIEELWRVIPDQTPIELKP